MLLVRHLDLLLKLRVERTPPASTICLSYYIYSLPLLHCILDVSCCDGKLCLG